MRGSAQAVRELLAFPFPSTSTSTSTTAFSPGSPSESQIPNLNLQVWVEREIMITLNGITARESRTIGRCMPQPVPPPFIPFSCESSAPSPGDVTLDWSGTLQLTPDISNASEIGSGSGGDGVGGGFTTPLLAIRDSTTLWVLPANVETNVFGHLRYEVGIRVVSDSWEDGIGSSGGGG